MTVWRTCSAVRCEVVSPLFITRVSLCMYPPSYVRECVCEQPVIFFSSQH